VTSAGEPCDAVTDRPGGGLLRRILRSRREESAVAIGFSLFLIAVGAIIAYAVDLGQVGPVDLQTAGQILLLVGVIGLILSLILGAMARRGPR
jgi:hypothetical protein